MRCLKCGYVTFDHLPSCKNCESSPSGLPIEATVPSTTRSKKRRVLAIVNGLLLFMGIGGFLFYWYLTSNRDGAIWAANRYFILQERAAFHDIYLSSSPGFRQSVSEEDFNRIMQGVASRLGRLNQRSLTGWRSMTNFFSGGPSVMLQYASQFEKGNVVETFVFIWDGTEWRLLGYNVNSPTLLSF